MLKDLFNQFQYDHLVKGADDTNFIYFEHINLNEVFLSYGILDDKTPPPFYVVKRNNNNLTTLHTITDFYQKLYSMNVFEYKSFIDNHSIHTFNNKEKAIQFIDQLNGFHIPEWLYDPTAYPDLE